MGEYELIARAPIASFNKKQSLPSIVTQFVNFSKFGNKKKKRDVVFV